MKIEYRKKFLKELSKIPSPIRRNIEKFAFEYVPSLESIFNSDKIEKLKGYDRYYESRFGDYRIGMQLKDEKFVFERALHRKEIYRYFP